jgi:hypothetical protein
VPFSALIGRKGHVIKRHTGELKREEVVGWIKSRLKENH